MKGTLTYRSVCLFGAVLVVLVFAMHCGTSTSIFDQADPVIYNGSLKTAPKTQPNLTIELLTVFHDSVAVERGKTIIASVKIHNLSQASVSEAFYITAFLTPQVATDRHWAQSWQISGLAAQQSKAVDVTFTVPSATPVGSYRLEYFVDYANRIAEYDETDNSLGPFSVQVNERLFRPDLTSQVLNYNAIAKTLSLRVSNGGGSIGKEIFFYKVYLSYNNQTLDGDDVLLYTGDNFTSNQFIELPYMGSFEELVPLANFSTDLSGDYYLLIQVDSDDLIPESNEANNLFSYFILSQP